MTCKRISIFSAALIIGALLTLGSCKNKDTEQICISLAVEDSARSGPFEDLVNSFNDMSDKYNISIDYYGSHSERTFEMLAEEFENHIAPDIIAINPNRMTISDQYIENLFPYFNGDDTLPNILPSLYDQLRTKDNELYIMPLSVWIDSYLLLGDVTSQEEMYLSIQGTYSLWYLQNHFDAEYEYDLQRASFTATGLTPSIPPVQINAESENKTAAWEFVKYALSTDAQISIIGYTSFPVTEDAFCLLLDAAKDGTVVGGTGFEVEESHIEKIRDLIDSISHFDW